MFPSRYHHSAARMTFEEFAKSVNEAVKNSKPTILIYPPPRFITFRPRFAVPPAMKKSREKCRPNFFLNYEILRIIPGRAQAGESPSPRPLVSTACCPRCIVKHGSMPADKRKFGIQSTFDRFRRLVGPTFDRFT